MHQRMHARIKRVGVVKRQFKLRNLGRLSLVVVELESDLTLQLGVDLNKLIVQCRQLAYPLLGLDIPLLLGNL